MSTYRKCTLSAITHRLNVPGHMLIWIYFHVLVCGTRAQNFPAPFSYTLYTPVGNSNMLTKEISSIRLPTQGMTYLGS
jgi:hypothetical protein